MSVLRDDRVGEVRRANNGMLMKILAYRSVKDIDVQFEDGVIVRNKRYSAFDKGNIGHPTVKFSKVSDKDIKRYLGMEKVMSCGMKATIIAYRNTLDIDVRFEDGTVVEHKTIHSFKTGYIKNPNIANYMSKTGRVGDRSIANNGMSMTIIKYISRDNMTVRFDDGFIKEGVSYSNFINGRVAHDGVSTMIERYSSKHLHERNKMLNGLWAEIIAYRSTKDIDVRFDNGVVVKNRSYNKFNKGLIALPLNRLGQVIVTSCGLKAKIAGYRSVDDLDILYEDGCKREHTSIRIFNSGSHPLFVTSGRGLHIRKGYSFCGFTNLLKSFEYNGDSYFMCKDAEGKGQVLSLHAIMKLTGVKPAF